MSDPPRRAAHRTPAPSRRHDRHHDPDGPEHGGRAQLPSTGRSWSARSPSCSPRCPPGVVVDATLGGGGHARALLERPPAPAGRSASTRTTTPWPRRRRWPTSFPGRVTLRPVPLRPHRPRSRPTLGADDRSVGVLFDLGVSSPQLDRAERGFSYRHDAPLDMRMDRSTGPHRGRRRQHLRRGASSPACCATSATSASPAASPGPSSPPARSPPPSSWPRSSATPSRPPARRTGGHPAKRTFQAIRIEVNRELDILPGALDAGHRRCWPRRSHRRARATTRARTASSRTGCARPRPAAAPARPACPCVCGADRRRVRLLKRGGWTPIGGRDRARTPGPRAPACGPPSGSPTPWAARR